MRLLLLLTMLVALPLTASAETWVVDHDKTIITVDAAYRTSGKVTIRFMQFESDVVFDPKRPRVTKAHIVVNARSAVTGLFLLDPVVRGRDFLAVRKYPTIDFALKKLVQTGPSDADISGTITIRGITRPLELKARVFHFRPDDPDRSRRVASFNVWGEVDRTDFGMTARLNTIKTALPIRIFLALRPKP